MNEILSAVVSGMHADIGRMDRIAMNIANTGTAGYKRETAAAPTFAARVDSPAEGPDAGAGRPAVHLDLRPGTLRMTGQSLDLAIVGDGWFEVATEQGPAYTRRGDFRLDGRGRLVTQQGLPVLGIAGEIQLPHGSPVIDATGQVFAVPPLDGERPQPLAQLRIVQFDPAAAMRRIGDGLMHAGADAMAPREGSVEVRQGALENSNVSHMHEMVRLMETMRHMETLQKVALGYDDMLATAVRKLGEGS